MHFLNLCSFIFDRFSLGIEILKYLNCTLDDELQIRDDKKNLKKEERFIFS